MAVHAPVFNRAQQRALQSVVLPAPIGGINGRETLASNNPQNCIYAYNLVPSEYGMRTREGYRDWAVGLETAPGLGLGVRSIVPYVAEGSTEADDRLFAVTNEGLWDVTVFNDTPTLALAFAVQDDSAGYGNSIHYAADSGVIVVFYADSANGLFKYDPIAGTWAAVTDITGVDPLLVAHVTEHKQRLWLTQRDSTDGWYLAPGALSGAAVKFTFGAKFSHGGYLVGLYSWSLDSGAGIDDILVAVSKGGDVLPYQGSDPSTAATWEIIGSFYIGDIPAGRRIASDFGGNLRLLSGMGLTAMSDLIAGVGSTAAAESVSQNIARFLRLDIEQYRDDPGWEVTLYPSEGSLVINTPQRDNGLYIQYIINLSLAGEGWAFWRGVPARVFEPYQNHMMLGTLDNRVLRMDVPVDDVDVVGAGGQPVDFSVLHNFMDMGQPGVFKWGSFIRPNFLALQELALETRFLYDYQNIELPAPGPLAPVTGSLWDLGVWDDAVWSTSTPQPFTNIRGSWGPGRTMAVAMRGSSVSRTTLVSTDVMWFAGSPF